MPVVGDFPYCVSTSKIQSITTKLERERRDLEKQIHETLHISEQDVSSFGYSQKYVDEHKKKIKKLPKLFQLALEAFLKKNNYHDIPKIVMSKQQNNLKYYHDLDHIEINPRFIRFFNNCDDENQKEQFFNFLLVKLAIQHEHKKNNFARNLCFYNHKVQSVSDVDQKKQNVVLCNWYKSRVKKEAQALACINGNKTVTDFMKTLVNSQKIFILKKPPIVEIIPHFNITLHADVLLDKIIDAKKKEKQGLLFNQFHDDPDHSLYKLTGGFKWFRRAE